MKGLNKVFVIGNLGKDPETRFTSAGKAICNFSIAVAEQWKDKSGEKQEKTEWIQIAAFGKLADICEEYLKKGSRVHVEGKLQTNKWADRQNVTHYTTQVVISEMIMLGTKEEREDD